MISFLNKIFKISKNINNKIYLHDFIDKNILESTKNLTRLGTSYGGWIIPSNLKLSENSICYLAGAGEDISFDCALIKKFKCSIRIIDPTPRAIAHFEKLKECIESGLPFSLNNSLEDYYNLSLSDLSKIRFLSVGISDLDKKLKFYLPQNPSHVSCSIANLQKTDDFFLAQCYRLGTLMKMLGDSSIDLLKIDVEGAEYRVIKDIVSSNLLPRVLLVEFDEIHTPIDLNAGNRIKEHIDILIDAGMRCIAIEDSNATFIRVQ